MDNDIREHQLDNGLKILLKEIHTAPIVSHWVWYRVGSRYESPGLTGISHWVEHMQFKGTPGFPAGVLDKAISRDGGMWNAFTHMDWTTFFETMPADKVDLSIALEADRMLHSLFDSAEVESERTVVISEREGSENEPLFLLDEAVQSASFQSHPYRNEVVGSIADLRAITRDDLYTHYRKHYNPGNAVIAVAGDFRSDDMLEKLVSTYQGIPGSQVPAPKFAGEEVYKGERRVDVHGPGQTTYLQLAYQAPAAREEDFYAFTILDSLLTGPSSLNMFGGGSISNKTSRLYRRLLEGEYAVSINGSLQATYDPYLYTITITVRPEHSAESVLEQLDSELEKLREESISQLEVERAAKQARALFVYGSENITNQGFWLGYSEMFDHYAWFTSYADRLARVTPAAVKQVLAKYLDVSQRVVGIYHPDGAQA
ncbi:MAG: pitrilysin family protein [Anaerolineaceae bacterium]|jgi:zinc protease